MGWLIALPALLAGVILHNDILIVTSGLFAIAGSIGTLGASIKMKLDQEKENKQQN